MSVLHFNPVDPAALVLVGAVASVCEGIGFEAFAMPVPGQGSRYWLAVRVPVGGRYEALVETLRWLAEDDPPLHAAVGKFELPPVREIDGAQLVIWEAVEMYPSQLWGRA